MTIFRSMILTGTDSRQDGAAMAAISARIHARLVQRFRVHA
jgi:hypothetical protein